MPPLLPVLKLARLPAVLDRLAPAARVELDAHDAFAQDATVGAGIRSQGRTLLDPVDREILNVVSTGFPSESAPEEEYPFEHEYAAGRFPYSSGRRNQWVAAPGLRTLPS